MHSLHCYSTITDGNSSIQTYSEPSIMRIDFRAMKYNLEKFRNVVSARTKIMMMVKASAYGTGVEQIGRWAERTEMIDYLGVVYIAEGIEIRKSNVNLPIMVINIDKTDFDVCRTFNLEPVIFSISLLKQLVDWLKENDTNQTFPNIHIKINTGMNRLGLEVVEIPELLAILSNCTDCSLTIKSIYGHVPASDEPQADEHTAEQARLFLSTVHTLELGLGYRVWKHLCNSMGALRHTHLHFDMVRIGGGLYGVAECFLPFLSPLLPAISWISSITQIRRVTQGSTIGYNRRGRVNRDSVIGIIRVGYADGLRRQLGNGQGYACVHNCRVPYIGSICMDFAMIDLTDVPVDNEQDLENEPVELFGEHANIEEVAKCSNTIAFEFISTIGLRVKRVYIDDPETKQFSSNINNTNM